MRAERESVRRFCALKVENAAILEAEGLKQAAILKAEAVKKRPSVKPRKSPGQNTQCRGEAQAILNVQRLLPTAW